MSFMNPVADLFGKSPIRPMQEHMKVSVSATRQLFLFFDAVTKNDWTSAEKVYNDIRDIEHRADELKKELRLHLPKSLFLPVPRGDLLELLTVQDKLANISKDVAGLMLGRTMSVPEPLQQALLNLVQKSVGTAQQAAKAIEELDELLESGFSGQELKIVERLVTELDDKEHQTDDAEVSARAGLFAMEADLPPVDVMFMYRVIELLGDLADQAQRVGSRLQLLLAR